MKRLRESLSSAARSLDETARSLEGTTSSGVAPALSQLSVALAAESTAVEKSGPTYAAGKRLPALEKFAKEAGDALTKVGRVAEAAKVNSLANAVTCEKPDLPAISTALDALSFTKKSSNDPAGPSADELKRLRKSLRSAARSLDESARSLEGTASSDIARAFSQFSVAIAAESTAAEKSGLTYPADIRLPALESYAKEASDALTKAGKVAEAAKMNSLANAVKNGRPDLPDVSVALEVLSGLVEAIAADVPQCCGRDIRTIVGFEQSGASNAESRQTIFLNFFISGPLPFWRDRQAWRQRDNMGPRWRWFSDFRLTSAPRSVDSSFVEFANTFSQFVGSLKPTELAQAAEFLTGIGWRFASFRRPFSDSDGATHRVAIYLLASAGATGFLGSPPNPRTYVTPEKDSAQENLFKRLYSTVPLSKSQTENPRDTYIGFIPNYSEPLLSKTFWERGAE